MYKTRARARKKVIKNQNKIFKNDLKLKLEGKKRNW